MARLAISKDYFPAYARLPRKAQRKADEFLTKFQRDSTAAAIHLEPLHATVDKQLRSARIGDDYRVILRAPEKGDIYLVLWADHHDEAYRWAATKQTAIHPATGSLQIFDATVAAAVATGSTDASPATGGPAPGGAVRGAPQPPAELGRGLFQTFSDQDLFLAGVPRPLLPSVRALLEETDLDTLLPHLPPESGEVLTALAAGIGLDEALEEVLGRTPPPSVDVARPPPIDTADVTAALGRDTTQRQFRLFDDAIELDAALKHPLDIWRVYLHPRQRRMAHARTKGPTRVLGGPGTGKTVVALHRAAFLVREVFRKPDDRVLFTTFTVNLAHDLRTQLGKLLEPEDMARVEIINLDAWASEYLRRRGRPTKLATGQDQKVHLRSACQVYGLDHVTEDFYLAELRDVILEQNVRTEEEYVRVVRRNRGLPLSRPERRQLWPVFAAYRQSLAHDGLLDPIDILRRAREELEAEAATRPAGEARYRAVIVDEVQDFGAEGLRLVRAIAGPERPDDLFLVGDAHQRIYGRLASLSSCGIQVRGRRSQTLRLNYRTTGAICRWSLGLLGGIEVDDLDDGKADRRGYVSVREGPWPRVQSFTSRAEEEAAVVATVRRCLVGGVPPEHICVASRAKSPLEDRFLPALERAGIAAVLLQKEEPRHPAVRLATMHRVKGLEFAVVILVGISKREMPGPSSGAESEDALVAEHALARERALLYVAASRARDELHVLFTGAPSVFLEGLMAGQPLGKQPVAAAPRGSVPVPPAAPSPVAEPPPSPARAAASAALLRPSSPHDQDTIRKAVSRTADPLPIVEVPSEASADHPPAWNQLRASLTPDQRAIPLDSIALPARIHSYCAAEHLSTLGELAARSKERLVGAANLGRSSVKALAEAVRAHFRLIREDAALVASGLLECFERAVSRLDTIPRLVITRRSGLGGPGQVLAEVGEMLGVTRERVRQMEQQACRELGRQPWAQALRPTIEAAITDGAASLEELRNDPWWLPVCEKPEVLEYVIQAVLEMPFHQVEVDGEHFIAAVDQAAVDEAWKDMRRSARQVSLPAPLASFDSLGSAAAKTVGPRLARELVGELTRLMRIEPGRDGTKQVLAIGDTREAQILAVLRSEPEPIRADALYARIGGRAGLPEEAIHFGRGRVGLKQHFPDFERWQARLLPSVIRVMQQEGPTRQWSCGELLDELREEVELPDWLTQWGLAALIKQGPGLSYLGRLRVALPGVHDEEGRVHLDDAIAETLREAGAPLPRDVLAQRLRRRIAVTDLGLTTTLQRFPFIRVDDSLIGLLDRDVPGGQNAIAEATEHAAATLARRGRGLSLHHLRQELLALGPVYQQWTADLVQSVLRTDSRFRFSRSGAVGLFTWESTRVPTRLELVSSAIQEGHGRVSVDAVLNRIEAHYGERPSRNNLSSLVASAGGSLNGDWIHRETQPSAAPA